MGYTIYTEGQYIDPAELEKALTFYEQSPTGQYDDIAAHAIRQYLRIQTMLQELES